MRKIVSLVLAALLLPSFFTGVSAAEQNIYGKQIEFDYDRNDSYKNYIKQYNDKAEPKEAVSVNAASGYSIVSGEVLVQNFNEKTEILMFGDTESEVSYDVNVPEEGLYSVELTYSVTENTKRNLEIGLKVNGETPYNELLSNTFRRSWVDKNEIEKDKNGNDVRPRQEQKPYWQSELFNDDSGIIQSNMKVFFSAGTNKISLTTNGEEFALSEIRLINYEETPTYAQYCETYKDAKKPSGDIIKVQAETPEIKSDATLYAASDRTSPLTEPYGGSKISLNIISSTNWSNIGQWITWKMDVPEDGLYKIGFKYMQNLLKGMFASRKIYINGKIPFRELNSVRFEYNTKWNMNVLGDESGEPYYIYLKKGSNEIKAEVVMGEVSNSYYELENVLYDMQEMYRRILMITGASPDSYRDYNIEQSIPDFRERFAADSKVLREQYDYLKKLSGGQAGENIAFLDRCATTLDELVKNPDSINKRLSSVSSNNGSLGSWILGLQTQPISVDYIIAIPEDADIPKYKATWFDGVKNEATLFLASFFEEYKISDVEETDDAIHLWIGTGRDQANIINNLVSDYFCSETGINVVVQLVQGSLLEATFAGRGPDITISVPSSDVMNYAVRNALVDFSKLDGFDEVKSRFHESAFEPFKFKDGIYAIPDTQTFFMMFYRKDILKAAGLGVPQTWDEFYRVAAALQRNNMVVAVPSTEQSSGATSLITTTPGLAFYQTRLFQNGGKYFKDTLDQTTFDEKISKDTFADIVYCYTRYNFPLTYSLYNRFRSGEMPLGIALYTDYNQLAAMAPEINGLWEMTSIPGIKREDGTIDRSVAATTTGVIMFDKGKDTKNGWNFVKWWSSKENQAQYGIEIENILGTSARYSTANLEAVNEIPWTTDEYNSLKNQWQYCKGVRELPGSYYLSRGYANAFRTAVNDYKNPYETLHKENIAMNNEITRKFKEFGLK